MLLGRALASPTLAVHLCSRDIYNYHDVACDLPYNIVDQKCISYTHYTSRSFPHCVIIPRVYKHVYTCMYVTSSRRTYMLQHVYSLQLAASARLYIGATTLTGYRSIKISSVRTPQNSNPRNSERGERAKTSMSVGREPAVPLRRRNIGRKAEKSESEGCRARRTDQTAAETAEEREARLQATRDRRALSWVIRGARRRERPGYNV